MEGTSETYEDKKGAFRFRLKSRDRAAVQRVAADAKVVDTTD